MTPAWRDLRVLAGLLAVVAALLLGSGLVIATHIQAGTDQLTAAAVAARQRANAANAVLLVMLDAESAQRGFLLTHSPDYLQPYHAVIDAVDDRLDALRALAAGSPALLAQQDRLAAAAHAKAAELRRTIDAAMRDGFDAALAIVREDRGKRAMDEVRATVTAIAGQSEMERDDRAADVQFRQKRIADAFTAGLSVTLVLLAAAGTLLAWNTTRLRHAQDRVRRQQAAFEAAVEHVPDGVAVFDANGALSLANVRFAPTLGLPPRLARPGTLLSAVAAAVPLDPPLGAHERPSRPGGAEATLGRRTLDVWRSPMPDGGQMLAVVDITRRVEAEAVARHAQKMEVLGQMTGGVAHDFNNLLQVVSANLELVRARLSRAGLADAALLSRLDAATAGVDRGARLTRHLLAFARRQQLAPETLDPATLLRDMEDTLRRTLGATVDLEITVEPGLWPMRADRAQFESALLNLALNARDAMTPPGTQPGPAGTGVAAGRLLIEAGNRTLDEIYAARAEEVLPGDYVTFAVSDTGNGMDAATMARAMEPFFTTKPEGQGTGLGLPMVLGFAKQSGGHFQLYSEPGHGTTARLYIPRSGADSPDSGIPGATAPPGRGELVLLVEDDPETRQAAGEALQSLGYKVTEADNGDAALHLLQSGLRPRALFTDVVMPGAVDARTLAARARVLAPGLGVLFTSGYTEGAAVRSGLVDAGAALLGKPWRLDELARAMRLVLDGPA